MYTIENAYFRLDISENCVAEHLICKGTGEECLSDIRMPLCTVTQERPYNNEIKLIYPNRRTTFSANRVRMEGDLLIVGFELAPYEAVIQVRTAEKYISFALKKFIVHPTDYADYMNMDMPPVSEFRLMQLPIRPRENFGNWLNVVWDDNTAVNVLATCPEARIEGNLTVREDARILSADAVSDIRLFGTEAALIVCPTERLMDAIGDMERDYHLPHGAESRRDIRNTASIYRPVDIRPDNVREHIRYAKRGGFSMMLIYYSAIFREEGGYYYNGDYDFRPEYTHGMDTLRDMLNEIKAAGITVGIHFLHTHIGLKSRYVTPKADRRLYLKKLFTLARRTEGDVLYVEENPTGAPLADKCRVLRFGGELMEYEGYSSVPPYCFTGIRRGAFNTEIAAHDAGEIGGVMDISEYGGSSCYLAQNSSLQDEIADKIANIYAAGFEFAYFDGSEGVGAPFGYHVANAQYRVYKKLIPEPIFAEGAAKAHFSWHMLSGGNAFDVFPAEVFKEKLREFPCDEAPRMRRDFTRLNFGWWKYWKDGTQPDALEYGTSRAAAWDCPATITLSLDALRENPRTEDNLEVMRRWEDVRRRRWLTDAQKEELKDLHREHILILNADGEYELLPCTVWDKAFCGDTRARVVLFAHEGRQWAAYWHTVGEGRMELPIAAEMHAEADDVVLSAGMEFPLGKRMYLCADVSEAAWQQAWTDAKILS